MHIISNEVDCMQDCRSRERLEGQWAPFQIFVDNLTLSHYGGKIMPTTLLLLLPARFSDLPTALVYSGIHYSHEASELSESVGADFEKPGNISQPGEADYAHHIYTRPPPPRIFKPSYGPELKRASPITKLCRQSSMSHVTNVSQYTIVLCPQILGGVLTYKIHFWEDLPRLPPKILQLTQNP